MAEKDQVDENMTGKTCLITGANDGIGFVVAKKLAERGARVFLHARNEAKAKTAAEKIEKETGKKVEYLFADFSSLKEVKRMAGDFLSKSDQLHVLVHNAGGYFPKRILTEDGFETTFAVNHLASFLLNDLLLDTMKKSAPGRIVVTSSAGHYRGRINFSDPNQLKRRYSGVRAYCQSKLANVLFANQLSVRLKEFNITANSLHPGAVKTTIAMKHGFGLAYLVWGLGRLFMISVEEGAETTLLLAASDEMENVSGKFFDQCVEREASSYALNVEDGKKLWDMSATMCGLKGTSKNP